MSVYQATVDPAERNTSHTMMLELVGSDKEVLDVGCASGYLAEALGKNGCLVSGIEYDPRDAEKAKPFLVELVVADLNEVDLAEQFPNSTFDTIVFGDVLEHLLDPQTVLTSSLKLLRPGGSVVISIPNVAHGSVRLALLQGRWNYTDTGLLDRTHIKFFTFNSLLAMLEKSGLAVTELRSTVADPLATEVGIDNEALPVEAVEWVRGQAHAQAYQFVLSAKLAEAGDDTDPGNQHVLPAIPLPQVRDLDTEIADLRGHVAMLEERNSDLDRQLTKEHAAVIELRRAVLTSRDYAIGAEAQVGRLRAQVVKAQQETHEARIDAHYAHTELAKAIKDAQNAHAALAAAHVNIRVRQAVARMVGPRVWRLMTAPFRPLRRKLTGR